MRGGKSRFGGAPPVAESQYTVYYKSAITLLDEAQEAEAVQVLSAILEMRENQAVQTPSVMCKIYYTMAMLHLVLRNLRKVSLSTCYNNILPSNQSGQT